MKKIAIDSYYYSENDCYTVGVIFEDWKDSKPLQIISCHISEFGAYIPGEFYKREMPGILKLLEMINLKEFDTIIVDGYLTLDNERPGLGKHVAEEISKVSSSIQVIGVAKSKFEGITAEPVLRGEAKNPIYVQGISGQVIKEMAGDYRIPDLLKILDKETKKYKKNG